MKRKFFIQTVLEENLSKPLLRASNDHPHVFLFNSHVPYLNDLTIGLGNLN